MSDQLKSGIATSISADGNKADLRFAQRYMSDAEVSTLYNLCKEHAGRFAPAG
jgi:hypothetical protein